MREYSESFKRKIVQRLLAPGGPTAVALSAETGVHQTTLSRWLRDARSVAPMSDDARRSAAPPLRPLPSLAAPRTGPRSRSCAR
ncbi:transposase [Sorangium sp. So ce363]|uniref:transposase n=1 Tax=Sorangium sp. So ce363 TaxID=3133304 RepID=UPI003F5F193E